MSEFIEYVGNLHIHSAYSDGAGTIPEVAQSAKRLDLDFIIFNDHDYMTENLHLEEEGFYNGVLVLLGLEIGGRYHHYLAYDVKEMIRSGSLSPQKVIDLVEKQGGFGFMAHPFEKGMPFSEKSFSKRFYRDLHMELFIEVERAGQKLCARTFFTEVQISDVEGAQ